MKKFPVNVMRTNPAQSEGHYVLIKFLAEIVSYFLLHLILFPRDKLVLMFSETTMSQIFVVPYSSSQEREKLS